MVADCQTIRAEDYRRCGTEIGRIGPMLLADRDPAPARPRGREQTARACPALRDLSVVATRHARKLDAVSPYAAPMVQLSLVPAAPRPRRHLFVHPRHLHTVRGRADGRRV